MRSPALIAVLITLPLLFACRSNPDGGSTGEVSGTTPHLSDICGYEWQLQSLEQHGEALPLEAHSSVTFQCTLDGKVAGMASINRYFGSFTLDNKGGIKWAGEGFGSTMMAGPEPLMQQEQAYLSALPQTRTMRLDGEQLVLGNEDNSLLLQFTRRAE